VRRLFLIALLALAGCGGDDEPAATTPAPTAAAETPAPDADPAEPSGANAYIGSIAIDPADGTAFLGTGLGLFEVEGADAERVTGTLDGEGDISSNLVVRFAGPGELVASGHPEGETSLPESLGLLRSSDGGKTWTAVAALGEADYHILQVTDQRVVAVRAEEADVLVSGDGGRSFQTRTPPAPPFDVAIDPADPARLIVSTVQGLFTSNDEGRSWRPRDPAPESQLAWGEDGVFRADAGGIMSVSSDGGETWEQRGTIGLTPNELAVAADGTLYASSAGGEVLASSAGGDTCKRFVKLR
jgi:hypothetical protein